MQRHALVSGGTGGIGRIISARLAEHGYGVVVLSRSSARAQLVVDGLAGGPHFAAEAGVTDSASLARAAEVVRKRYGALDLLVNCHGITTPVPHADLDALSDDWIDRIFATNWRGAFACVRAFRGLLMAANADGRREMEDGNLSSVIVNISSVAGTTGLGSNVAYAASKAALDSMTRSLARALAPHIRVVSVAPGWVLGEYAARFDAAYIRAQTGATPLKKLATPDDVADAVLAVCTLLNDTTGCIIPVDGGRPLGM